MKRYAILLFPSANRVYADDAPRLLAAELDIVNNAVLDGKIKKITQTDIAGVRYLLFEAAEFTTEDVAFIANLSSIYALFDIESNIPDEYLLRPIALRSIDVFPSDLLTIPKYQGKTNEQFTKLLFNVTTMALAEPSKLVNGKLRVLDPLCGRGTTLNQALAYGCDGYGIEIRKRDFDEYEKFIKTYLRNNRYKHSAQVSNIRRNKALIGRRLDITLGVTKEKYKAGDVIQLGFVNADTTTASEYFRAGFFDMIVTDVPYGIQHGSTSSTGGLARDPMRLLGDALPGWHRLLRTGGAIGISWNTFVADRTRLAALLTEHGFAVLDSPAHRDFEHRVDAAIRRDLIVARKS
ncbi:MAG: SAM-dependent methyltransferase [Sciscionella sp.]|nr:SAM-dependent methyltransferase [Sciscionella sp.]